MNIQTIDKNLLSDLHRKAVANERKRMNFDLRTSALDQSQRMLNALEPGTQVPVHRHMETAETTICIEGYLEVVLYAEVSGQDETGGKGSSWRFSVLRFVRAKANMGYRSVRCVA